MTDYNRVHSKGAIALGACCALGTLIVLFWHVRSPADLTTNHVLIALALVCALGSVHFLWEALRDWHFGSALFFLALSIASTGVCAVMSAGRGAEMLALRSAAVRHADGKRLNHERMIAEANVDRERALADSTRVQATAETQTEVAAGECRTGKKTKCEGATFAAGEAKADAAAALKRYQEVDARYWQLVAQLDQFKPAIPANIELTNMAKLWALASGYDEEKTLQGLELGWSFMLSFLAEMGTIGFLHYGIGSSRAVRTTEHHTEREEPFANLIENRPDEPFIIGNRIYNADAFTNDRALADLLPYIRLHGIVPSQEFLRARWRLRSKGTVSTWLKQWESDGLVRRQMDGRVKTTSAVE